MSIIKSLRVANFLSLENFSLNFTQRNALVGPNMSGKSNIINALQFLTQSCATNLNQALLEQQSLGDILFIGENSKSFLMSFSVDCTGPSENESFTYDLQLQGAGSGMFVVESEKLTLIRDGKSIPLIQIERGQGTVQHDNGTQVFSAPGTNHSALEFTVPGWYASSIRNIIANWQFFTLNPAMMRTPATIKGESFLQKNGSNFSSWLMTIQTQYPQAFRDIKNAALSCLPDLDEILTIPTQASTTFIATKEKGLRRNLPMWRMSDGELLFLAYLSLLYAPPELGAPVVCIEEPENYLNPKLLEQLIEIANQRRVIHGEQASQIILTTHSPSLVNKLDLDDLIVVHKKNGATSARRASDRSGEFRSLLDSDEVGLGELWQSGALNAD